ncbi:MAG: hypothetical protein KGJ11_00500 [Candidatus Omnitrophica bacterium]|nr:hypothetical protein [Candidatus Omnitrophota bacterium]
MIRDELNSRTEIIDLKAGVLFVQTEKGTYGVYDPQKKVMFGKNCAVLAQEVFNDTVIGELGKHVLNKETMGENGFLIGLRVDDAFYAVDFSTKQFVSSENWEDIEKILNKGVLGEKDEILNFETQMMNDEMGNALVMEAVNGEKLYKVMDVYGNSYPSNNLSAAMFDLTRTRQASLIQGENAYESKELQDEMGIYKGRKLSI